MEKLYRVLKTAVWCFIGVFIGRSIYQCYDYHTYPWVYELTSAPWYTSILVNGIFTAVAVAMLLAALYVVKRRIKKQDGSPRR